MREHFNFVGPGITAKEEASATHSLARAQRRENLFQESELEKTLGEQAAIEFLDDFLKREFLNLDIPEVPEVRPERFHVMSDEWFDKNGGETLKGTHHSFEDKVFLRRRHAGSPLDLYKTMFHEGVHTVSHKKYWVDAEKKEISEYRVGYQVTNTSREGDEHTHLEAFNEGVVEIIVEELFHRNSKEIQQKLSVSEDGLREVEFSYPMFREVVSKICDGLAQFQSVHKLDVWKKLKRGQFTGEMMHLRDLEYAYGKGTLRILDALQMGPKDQVEDREIEDVDRRNERILEFFENYDRPEDNREKVRYELAREILGEEMYEKYCQ